MLNWKPRMFVMFLHNRLRLPLPRQRNIKRQEGCKKFELVLGAHLLWEKSGVGCRRLLLVYDSFALTAIVHKSHICDAVGVRHIPPPPGSCVFEGSVGGWESAIIPSVGIMCALAGFNSLAVEAECGEQNVFLPYLLITSVRPLNIF